VASRALSSAKTPSIVLQGVVGWSAKKRERGQCPSVWTSIDIRDMVLLGDIMTVRIDVLFRAVAYLLG